MRCYICNEDLKEPQFDYNNRALPCPDCSARVDEAIADFGENEDYHDEDEYEYEDEEEPEDELP